MILNSDIILNHPLWERADSELKDTMGLFGRLVDIYIVACAIGIREDKTVYEVESPLIPPKSIGRNTYTSLNNSDLKDLLDFMLQNALLRTKCIDLDNEERIKLAFDPDYVNGKITAAPFLTGFANYGIEQIFENIDSQSPMIVISDLYSYFCSMTESDYDEILKQITLEELS